MVFEILQKRKRLVPGEGKGFLEDLEALDEGFVLLYVQLQRLVGHLPAIVPALPAVIFDPLIIASQLEVEA